jgi:hypothetical protein
MSPTDDFKQLERRAYLSYHQDGVIDIIVGLAMLGFGTYLAIDQLIFMLAAWLFLAAYVPLKRRITVPRFGYIEFGPERTHSQRKRGLISMTFLVILVAFILLVGIPGVLPGEVLTTLRIYSELLFGITFAFLLFGAALMSELMRFYAYAGLAVLLTALAYWLGMPAYAYTLALGGMILLSGMWMLARFLRRYPLAPEEGSNAASRPE